MIKSICFSIFVLLFSSHTWGATKNKLKAKNSDPIPLAPLKLQQPFDQFLVHFNLDEKVDIFSWLPLNQLLEFRMQKPLKEAAEQAILYKLQKGEDVRLGSKLLSDKAFKMLFNPENGIFRNAKEINLDHSEFNPALLRQLPDSVETLSLVGCRSHPETMMENLSHLQHLKSLDLSYNTGFTADTLRFLPHKELQVLRLKKTIIRDLEIHQINRFENLKVLEISPSRGLTAIDAISLSKLQNLEELNLASTHLVPEAIKAFSELPKLRKLDISYNKIGMEGIGYLQELKSLEELRIKGASIGLAEARLISGLTQLKVLRIGSNQLRDEGAMVMSHMTGLTKLEVQKNEIGDAGIEALFSLTDLKALNLSENRIHDLGLAKIDQLKNLECLLLGGNDLSSVGFEVLSRLPKLKILDIRRNNRIDGQNIRGKNIAKAIANLTHLEKLDISENGIGPSGAKAVSRISSLKALIINKNNLRKAGAEHIGRMNHLETLSISHNGLRNSSTKFISQLSGLKRLNISVNEISDKGALSIAKMKNLQDFWIQENILSLSGERFLHEHFLYMSAIDERTSNQQLSYRLPYL